MGKRTKKTGVLYTPLPNKFFEHLAKLNPKLSKETKDLFLEDREIALFNKYGLQRPIDLQPVVRDLIQKMAIDLKIIGFMDEAKVRLPGQPTKWLSSYGMIFVNRVEEYKRNNPNKSWINIMRYIKKEYKYTESAENLYIRYREILKNPLSYAFIAKIYLEKGKEALTQQQMLKLLEIESIL